MIVRMKIEVVEMWAYSNGGRTTRVSKQHKRIEPVEG
jgi:hypothetical protein